LAPSAKGVTTQCEMSGLTVGMDLEGQSGGDSNPLLKK